MSRIRIFLSLLLLASALLTSAAHADFVVLKNGRTIKVEGTRAQGDTTELSLAGGGTLRLPTVDIDRIANDETTVSEWQFQTRAARYRKFRDLPPRTPPAAAEQ